VELALAVVSGVLGIVTLVTPHWIEAVTGFDFDHSSGLLEWVVTAFFMLVAFVAAMSARKRYLHLLKKSDR
jgi:hypothetical protein